MASRHLLLTALESSENSALVRPRGRQADIVAEREVIACGVAEILAQGSSGVNRSA
jgi:hypothetical protein